MIRNTTRVIRSVAAVAFLLTAAGCNLLDRPPLTATTDTPSTWKSEDVLRSYSHKYLAHFFPGFAVNPFSNDIFSDDFVQQGVQGNFGRSVPSSGIWSMGTLRSINLMIERIETDSKGSISEEAYAHWMGVARLYRGLEYASIVAAYGDVPYYDKVLKDDDLNALYKPRDPRNMVMDHVYEDWKYAMENIRLYDGSLTTNRYVAYAVIARHALREASWQKYYYKDKQQAQKFYELVLECTQRLIDSGKYDISTDYRTLFTSLDLSGNKECILYRHYDPAEKVLHSVASNSNPKETIFFGGTTDLIKSYICVDGDVWETSEQENAKSFAMNDLIRTRDARFEATFYDKPTNTAFGSYLFPVKYFPRFVIDILESGQAIPSEYSLSNNPTDHPVLRYAEVLLNRIEAKAELADMGVGSLSQEDIDRSINLLRKRPIAKEATEKGVKPTKPLSLASLPNDPRRDRTVSPILWEIRRERRMEMCFENTRYRDLKRWHKLEYMDTESNPDLLSGTWLNFPKDLPHMLSSNQVGKISVVNDKGAIVVYDGSNEKELTGFFRYPGVVGRLPFLNLVNVNIYLSPVGKNQMDNYASKGYSLKQTEGWPDYTP